MGSLENRPEFSKFTTGYEVASHLKDQIRGKTILITGVAEGGLGAEAALTIASSAPQFLILSAHSSARAEPVSSSIATSYPNVTTKILPMDLASLASVRQAAAEIGSWENAKVDVIINNAAIMAAPYSTTVDGFESHFAICHLAHFLFVNLLLKAGKVADEGRIVNIASAGHRFSDVRFDDPGFENGKAYNGWRGYGQAKTANMLFSVGLAQSKQLQARKILSFSLHPGGILGTSLGKYFFGANASQLAKSRAEVEEANGNTAEQASIVMKNIQQGISTYIVAAFDPSIAHSNGSYLEDCHIIPPRLAYAGDPEGAKRLWALSEEMVGEKFDIFSAN